MARNDKPRTQQDEIQYCDRCGISFLWSAEQRRQMSNGQPPLYCPGCRQLLPGATRERGLVKWFNNRRHYGFIIRYDQPDIFVHGSQIKGQKRLRPGQLVEFRVAEGEQGPTANEVRVLWHMEVEIP